MIELNVHNISLYIRSKHKKFVFTHSGVKSRGKHLWMSKFCKDVRKKSTFQGFTHMNLRDLPAKMPPTGEQRRARRMELADIKI